MDIRKIKKLIDLMIESDLRSLEVKEGEHSVSMSRNNDIVQTAHNIPQQDITTVAKPKTGRLEKSPMVGVFYTASKPNEANFVTVGQAVKAGDTLGIVEAMKIMNPIEATQNGIVDEILVVNGDVVEFDQPIVRFKD